MSPDPLLFSTSSSPFPWLLPIISEFTTNLENLRFEGVPYQDEKVMEGNIQQILDMITSTNPGRVKVEENSLLLDFQGNSIEGLSMSNCLIEPHSLTPLLTSCSSSSFSSSYPTLFTFPSSISNPSFNQSVLCDNVNEDSTLAATNTTCEYVPFTSSSSSPSPSSHTHLNMFPPTIQSTSHPELVNNDETSLIPCPSGPSLSLDSCFGAPTNPLINIDQENYLVNHAKQAHVDGVSPSLLLTTLNYPEVALPLPLALSSSHGSLCATHDELSASHDIVSQESFVNSSPRGYPKPSIALTDCCSDLLGSTRHHHHHHHQYIHQHHDPPSPHTLLEDGNLPLNMLHGSTMQSTSLDAFGHLNISHHNHNGEFVRPFLHGEGGRSSLSELDNPDEDLKVTWTVPLLRSVMY